MRHATLAGDRKICIINHLEVASHSPVSTLQTVVCSLNTPGIGNMPRPVAYYRVSTQRQGRSGLGIEAQRAAVARFAEAEGMIIVQEFTEIETGKGADALDRRPQLNAALALARQTNARSSWPSSTACRAMSPSLLD
ncbi:recombinase family protein [Mesorhizobium sp.]|uniref:recombinase family protein n=1 Tax=Mesorhizobium sp. TaxID=1871066 RepID=UPI0026C2B59B